MAIIDPFLYNLVREAGKSIMEVYHNDKLFHDVEVKDDRSPLTLADKRSHEIIHNGLSQRYPDIPVISEEGRDLPYEFRKHFNRFWLVDPLDGTKEFIHRNDEFTVNIALIENRFPVLGLIYAPVQDKIWAGSEKGAFVIEGENSRSIEVRGSEKDRVAVRSRSHASPEEAEVLERYLVKEEISRGSSLKFCAVAEGTADLYYRHGPTMEWDTAAGQAILEAAGGSMFRGNQEGQRFSYNKESLLNGGFLCLGF